MNFSLYLKLFVKDTFSTIGLLLFLVIIVLFFIKPTVDNIFETKERLAMKEEKRNILAEKEAILKGINLQQLNDQQAKITEAIPNTIDLPLILATLQKIAEDSNVKLGEFSLSSNAVAVTLEPVSGGTSLSTFGFNVKFSGKLDDLELFIDNLSGFSPIIRVEGLNFSNEAATLAFRYYFQPRQAFAKIAVDAPLTAFDNKSKKTLEKIASLTPPVLEEPESSSPSAISRESPFR